MVFANVKQQMVTFVVMKVVLRPFRFLQGYPIGPYPRIGLPPNDIGP